jgi:hypothetical protein
MKAFVFDIIIVELEELINCILEKGMAFACKVRFNNVCEGGVEGLHLHSPS